MLPDSIIQLCINLYGDDVIEHSSKSLFELCADPGNRVDRYRRRQGDRKKLESMRDIIDLIQRRGNMLPVTFVASDLSNLPPVSLDNIDVCAVA